MKRLPPYTIVAVCGILFLSAGMVIITADSTDPAAQPTAEVSTPTDVVSVPVDQPPPVVEVPTTVPVQPVEPVVPPTAVEVVPPVVVPTEIPVQQVEQPVIPTALETAVVTQPTAVLQSVQPTVIVADPNEPVGAGGGASSGSNGMMSTPVATVVGSLAATPVIPLPNSPLGTLPPPANVLPQNPVIVIIPTNAMPVTLPLMQVAGQIGAPLKADNAGIVVVLTRPDGTASQTITDPAGNFSFRDLPAGTYQVDAGAAGYLTARTTFTVLAGQSLILPAAALVVGDTNLDNKIDLSDAALIAANFDGANVIAGADLNHDGFVDIRDLTAIGAYFGLVGPTSWKP